MRILITGGAGFQGSRLAEHWIGAGHDVTVLNTFSKEAVSNIAPIPKQVSVVWGSVTDKEIVEKTVREQDVVVHMAAWINVDESIAAPTGVIEVNVMGTQNILEAVKRSGARLIFSSSCEVYGGGHAGAVSEASELRPYSPYAASKAAADRLCFAYWVTYGLNVVIVRPCNVFGPRQKSGRGGAVIPIFVRRAASKNPLTVFGTGGQRREYMYVDDLVAGYDLLLGKNDVQGQVFNLGTGNSPSVKEIAQYVAGHFDVPIEYGPARPGEVDRFALNCDKARAIGFTPKVNFWEGLKRYIQWYASLPELQKLGK